MTLRRYVLCEGEATFEFENTLINIQWLMGMHSEIFEVSLSIKEIIYVVCYLVLVIHCYTHETFSKEVNIYTAALLFQTLELCGLPFRT